MRACLESPIFASALMLLTGATLAGLVAAESLPIDVSAPLAYVRIFADAEGVSHFAEEELPFELVDYAPPAPPISVSTTLTAESVAFLSSPSGWSGDWHPAPRRQLMLLLSGELEVEVADGETRVFEPGAVILVEDVSGKGHVSRVVSDERAYMAAIPLGSEM